MSAKHTPGPWGLQSWDLEDVLDFAVSKDGRLTDYSVMPKKGRMPIASIQHCFNGKSTYANARLIAAAPDLLEALQYAVRQVNASECDINFIRKAIAKATGDAA